MASLFERIPEQVFAETLATFLQPVQHFLEDTTVSEILINGPDEIYYEKRGQLHKSDVRFGSIEDLEGLTIGVQQGNTSQPIANRLVAAGFGEFQPLDGEDTPDARNKNRRIELKLTER